MKPSHKQLCLQIAAVVLALSFGARAYAETAREEVAHAYFLLKLANSDYGGHRGAAMNELKEAGRALALRLEGDVSRGEQQWKSDQQLEEARRLLRDARNRLEAQDRDRVAARVDRAIHELDLALSFQEHAQTEAPRQQIAHAYRLLKLANSDYGGHRVNAMNELKEAGKALALRLEGDISRGEQQWKSDKQLEEARRLLREARNRLEAQDRDRIAARVDSAIREIDLALKVR